MTPVFFHTSIIVLLTILSQLGGIAWLVALAFKNRVIAFLVSYTIMSTAALWIAPMFGREPLSCRAHGNLQMQSVMFCALNRHYVVPELNDVLVDYANRMDQNFPNTVTNVLDANFPFVTGFPLLPHLSHDDGRKVDLAFYYADETGYLAGVSRSPIGYFAFQDGPSHCSDNGLTLRWDMAWLQGVWPPYQVDAPRMRHALQLLESDGRVGKVFVEPHLKQSLGVQSPKIRFQGCRAARHDDHIHIQL